jgi:XTP/dITP diphosphohydrolase
MKLPDELVVATGNSGKLAELSELLTPLGVAVRSPADLGWEPDTPEDGETLEMNALTKAREAVRATGIAALADDSGLFVNALGGAPGVHSARYSGEIQDSAANCVKLLGALEGLPPEERGAEFRCVIALVDARGKEQIFSGTCRGRIGTEPRGKMGFGYDPVFVSGNGRTFAEMDSMTKHRISHRGRALEALRAYLAPDWEDER